MLFWCAVVFCNLLLNNLLIGIMYDSYQRLHDEAEKVKNFAKIMLQSDYIDCCNEDANITNLDYVYVCESAYRPPVEDEDPIEETNRQVSSLADKVETI